MQRWAHPAPALPEASIRFRPFRAGRPVPAIAAKVASPPYDVVNRDEAAQLARGNPFSFLHVIRAEIDLPGDVGPYDEKVYAKARQNLDLLHREGTFERDAAPVVYVYELTWEGRSQVGVVGCLHVDDYASNTIRKHELTRPDKEDDRTRHMLAVNAHAEPVLLAHPPQPFLSQLNAKAQAGTPLFDFEADDGVRHRVWRVAETGPYVDAIRRLDRVYVADGHHRCASAVRAAQERRKANPKHTGDEEYNWFLGVLFSAAQLRILPYHRIVRELNGLSPDEFRNRLRTLGALEPTTTPLPDRAGVFGVRLGDAWYRLTMDPALIDSRDPIRSLDASVLQDQVLGPLLGIMDVRTDKRIDFVGGIRGVAELERRVASGDAAAAFAMHPVTLEQLMTVADAGAIMPPKSTWFEPKLRSGLFVHALD